MKRLIRGSVKLFCDLKFSIVVMLIFSIFGGYQLSRLIYGMNDLSLNRTDQLLTIEENLDKAAITLGQQIQEWKDMLLRANDSQQYSKHQKAFTDSSVEVQYALMRANMTMMSLGLDTGAIEQLRSEHKTLLSSYLRAYTLLSPQRPATSHLVDMQVVGVDRNLQQHIATIKTDIEHQVKQQLNGTIPSRRNHYLLIVMLSASLLFMASVGFLFAYHFLGHENGTSENLSVT